MFASENCLLSLLPAEDITAKAAARYLRLIMYLGEGLARYLRLLMYLGEGLARYLRFIMCLGEGLTSEQKVCVV